jgi:predicted DNA-binding protein
MAKKARYTSRLSIGLTPEQVRRLDELGRVRAKKSKPHTRADLIRDAINLYLLSQGDLMGSRKAIAKSIEGKIADLDQKLDQFLTLDQKVDRIGAMVQRLVKKGSGNG